MTEKNKGPNLTSDRGIAAIKPPEKDDERTRVEYRQGQIPGLRLRVSAASTRYPAGLKMWVYQYRAPDGRTRKSKIGMYPAIGLAVAKNAAKELLRQVEGGIDPVAERERADAEKRAAEEEAKAASDFTFGKVVEKFIEVEAPRRYSQPDKEVSPLRAHAIPAWQDRPITAITKVDVEDLVAEVWEKARSSARRGARGTIANRLLGKLRAVFKWAAAPPPHGLRVPLLTDPTIGVVNPSDESPRILARMPDEDVAALWRAAGAEGYPYGVMTKLYVLTGARRSELELLVADEVDLDARVIRLQPGRKGCKTRRRKIAHEQAAGMVKTIHLSSDAVALLKSLPKPAERRGPFLFSRDDGLHHVEMSKDVCARLAKAAGIGPWSAHKLRHVTTSLLKTVGTDPTTAAEIVGHKIGHRINAEMTERYTHDDPDQAKRRARAVERLAGKIRSIVSEERGSKVVDMAGVRRG